MVESGYLDCAAMDGHEEDSLSKTVCSVRAVRPGAYCRMDAAICCRGKRAWLN